MPATYDIYSSVFTAPIDAPMGALESNSYRYSLSNSALQVSAFSVLVELLVRVSRFEFRVSSLESLVSAVMPSTQCPVPSAQCPVSRSFLVSRLSFLAHYCVPVTTQ
ncbi:hypothetical protein ACMFMG_010059 [Clarireedia jacksonii]